MSFAWERVDALLDKLDVDLARAHGLGPLAARRRRLRGEQVPEPLALEERSAATAHLIAPTILTHARAAYDGKLVLLKGPEITIRYPSRARRFGDLDLLADDAEAAQAGLLANGFELEDREWPPPGYEDADAHYHLHPLQWPGLPLNVEIHREVKWPPGLEAPPNDEIFSEAVPSSIGIDGLLTPPPHQHAVLLAAHAWGEIPLRTIREVIDVMVFADEADRADMTRVAERWGLGRAWRSTIDVGDWLLDGGKKPMSVRLWARHLAALREPKVIEMHIERWLSPFWMFSPGRAVARSARAVANDFTPAPDETWRDKRRQTLRALSHPFSQKSEHERRSGREIRRRIRRSSPRE
jgi:Uncharacterised nucleotidyltransferase